MRAFWYAIITRDQPRMTELCELPLDVLRASGADHDDYLYHWAATLRAYWPKRPELVHWTATPERAEDLDGRVPVAVLAIVRLAYDGGIPVRVESAYLPEHLLRRSWVGEFEV
ncbi:immunity 49 family protein [Streptomyces sp. NPDC059985]|uniref:immunity 49 family protein n=1 Tax=Streptomyces sp. NPDC059985 TaxID=3347025 RepID=UPI0036BA6F4B